MIIKGMRRQKRVWRLLLFGLVVLVAVIVGVEFALTPEVYLADGIDQAILRVLGDFIYLFTILGGGVVMSVGWLFLFFWVADRYRAWRTR